MSLDSHVNSSGFPLQMAVKHLINAQQGHPEWRCTSVEHAWSDRESGESGFIDLIVENGSGTQVLVVECKRVLDTSWIFLVESGRDGLKARAKSLVFRRPEGGGEDTYWRDVMLEPESYESGFCVIPGGDQRSKSLLERAGADLVQSVEAFSREESPFLFANNKRIRCYYTVLVTTARLKACIVDPGTISLSDGKINGADYRDVPFIRFRKQLSTTISLPAAAKEVVYVDVAKCRESTVFVVNSEYLMGFLGEFFPKHCRENNFLGI